MVKKLQLNLLSHQCEQKNSQKKNLNNIFLILLFYIICNIFLELFKYNLIIYQNYVCFYIIKKNSRYNIHRIKTTKTDLFFYFHLLILENPLKQFIIKFFGYNLFCHTMSYMLHTTKCSSYNKQAHTKIDLKFRYLFYL